MSKAAVDASTKFRFDELKSLTDGDIQRVNQVIIDNLSSPVALINQLTARRNLPERMSTDRWKLLTVLC